MQSVHTKGNELSTLQKGFNFMQERLKQAFLRLERRDQEKEKLISELNKSNEELERFAYIASHDLQEPLRMISNFSALLNKQESVRSDEKSEKYLGFLMDGSQRASVMIKDILSYSRLNQPQRLESKVDLNAIMKIILHQFEESIESKGARIEFDELPMVSGNPTQLQQLFSNLISNALKFQPPGNRPLVQIKFVSHENSVCFSVTDNGIGIEPQYQQKIFQIFQRLHGRSEYPGTGIGLATCQKIVEQHGGELAIDSKAGEGSTFTFSIFRNRNSEPE